MTHHVVVKENLGKVSQTFSRNQSSGAGNSGSLSSQHAGNQNKVFQVTSESVKLSVSQGVTSVTSRVSQSEDKGVTRQRVSGTLMSSEENTGGEPANGTRSKGEEAEVQGLADTPEEAILIGHEPKSAAEKEDELPGEWDKKKYAAEQPDVLLNLNRMQAVTIKAPLTVLGKEVQAVVDTGAEVSVMSDRLYDSLEPEQRPPLNESRVGLVVAEKKTKLKDRGLIEANIELNGHQFLWPVYVAPISDDFLLGCDIIDDKDLLVSSKRGVQIGSEWISCEVTRRPCEIARLKLDRNVVIPGNHEVVIPVSTSGVRSTQMKIAALEPVVEDQRDILIARCAVDLQNRSVPVRLANLGSKSVELKKGYPLGELHVVDQVIEMEEPSDDAAFRGKYSDTGENAESEQTLNGAVPEHLQELYEESCKSINSAKLRQRLAQMLIERKSAFAKSKLDLGCCSVLKHHINTAGAAPIRQPLRRTPKGFESEEEQYLKEQLEAGVVVPSSSEWASPVVLVRKQDGSVRWCLDYRKLNDVTVKDAYPLPRIDMCLDCLAGARYFSILDLQSGYWQILLSEKDRAKTAFITKYGLFEYTKMPFGLCSAPGTFQRCMELVLRGLQWKTLLIYLDDVIVVGNSVEESLERLDEVLVRLESAGLKLKPSKCKLLQEEVLFLGHVVGKNGIQPNPKLIDAVKNWKAPVNKKAVQQYLGLCNYYRKFIPNFSDIAFPLTQLTRKEAEFDWTDSAQRSFETLKASLCQAPILAYPMNEGEFILDTDASDVGIGAVLQQVQDGKEHVIAYSSKKLDKQQRRYCVTRKELLAVVTFLREFRHYLLGRKFTVRSDHSSLRWLMGFKEPQGQLARWLEYISEYDFKIVHRAGKRHDNADALSRQSYDESCTCEVSAADLPCKGCDYCKRRSEEWRDFHETVNDVIPLGSKPEKTCRRMRTRNQVQGQPGAAGQSHLDLESNHSGRWFGHYTVEQMRSMQLADPDIGPIDSWLESGSKPTREEVASCSPATRSYWLNFDNLTKENGVLYLKWQPDEASRPATLRLLVPRKLRKEVLTFCHDHIMSAHQGISRTVQNVKRRFHWYQLSKDVKLHIHTCSVCSANRQPYRRYKASLCKYQVGAPMDRIAIDIMGPLPVSSRGNKYILVIGDYFTRWVEAFALPDQQAETVARTLVTEFVARYGAPLELHSDQARNFESDLFKEVCNLLDITKTRSTPYHPSSNGMIERFNKTLASMIRSYISNDHQNWDVHIPFLTSAYRSTVHPSTGFSPNFLMFGREVNLPPDILYPRAVSENCDPAHYAAELSNRLTECYDTARRTLRATAERQHRNHDTRLTQHKYHVGDLVYKRFHIRKKLEIPWVGPYIVTGTVGDVLYRVCDKKKSYVLHHDLLNPYTAKPIPKWVLKQQKALRKTG